MSTIFGRLLLLLGGGAAGVQLTQNKDTVDSLKGEVLKYLLNTPKGDSGLDSKLDGLSAEMRALAAANSKTVVVQNGGGSTITRVMWVGIPGVAVYYWMRFNGYTLNDMKWVSNAKFSEAVSAMKATQEQLGGRISEFRVSAEQALAAFQDIVERRFRTITNQINEQVGAVEGQVATVSSEVRTVDNRVQRMEGKMDSNAAMLERTSKGVQLLCNVVAEAMGGNTKAGKELQSFLGDQAQIEGGPAIQQIEAPEMIDGTDIPDDYQNPQGSNADGATTATPSGGFIPLGVIGSAFSGSRAVHVPRNNSEPLPTSG